MCFAQTGDNDSSVNSDSRNASLTKRRNFRNAVHHWLAKCAINEMPDEYISAIDHYEAMARTDIPVMVYRSNNRQHVQ